MTSLSSCFMPTFYIQATQPVQWGAFVFLPLHWHPVWQQEILFPPWHSSMHFPLSRTCYHTDAHSVSVLSPKKEKKIDDEDINEQLFF